MRVCGVCVRTVLECKVHVWVLAEELLVLLEMR